MLLNWSEHELSLTKYDDHNYLCILEIMYTAVVGSTQMYLQKTSQWKAKMKIQ